MSQSFLLLTFHTPANIFSLARYKFGLDKSYKHIWVIYDFQQTIQDFRNSR